MAAFYIGYDEHGMPEAALLSMSNAKAFCSVCPTSVETTFSADLAEKLYYLEYVDNFSGEGHPVKKLFRGTPEGKKEVAAELTEAKLMTKNMLPPPLGQATMWGQNEIDFSKCSDENLTNGLICGHQGKIKIARITVCA